MRKLGAILLSGAAWVFFAGSAVPAQSAPAPSRETPPAPSAKPAPAPADDNAFPEAVSEAAEKDATAADKSAADGPAANPDRPSSDSGVPESSSRSRMKGVDLLGDHDHHAPSAPVVNPKLANDDIRIGQLYMGDGNYPGAYARFKEATEVGPGNAEAVFYLAEAARKTAHLDEAATNYGLYLAADPKGKHGKDARKALAELAGK